MAVCKVGLLARLVISGRRVDDANLIGLDGEIAASSVVFRILEMRTNLLANWLVDEALLDEATRRNAMNGGHIDEDRLMSDTSARSKQLRLVDRTLLGGLVERRPAADLAAGSSGGQRLLVVADNARRVYAAGDEDVAAQIVWHLEANDALLVDGAIDEARLNDAARCDALDGRQLDGRRLLVRVDAGRVAAVGVELALVLLVAGRHNLAAVGGERRLLELGVGRGGHRLLRVVARRRRDVGRSGSSGDHRRGRRRGNGRRLDGGSRRRRGDGGRSVRRRVEAREKLRVVRLMNGEAIVGVPHERFVVRADRIERSARALLRLGNQLLRALRRDAEIVGVKRIGEAVVVDVDVWRVGETLVHLLVRRRCGGGGIRDERDEREQAGERSQR